VVITLLPYFTDINRVACTCISLLYDTGPSHLNILQRLDDRRLKGFARDFFPIIPTLQPPRKSDSPFSEDPGHGENAETQHLQLIAENRGVHGPWVSSSTIFSTGCSVRPVPSSPGRCGATIPTRSSPRRRMASAPCARTVLTGNPPPLRFARKAIFRRSFYIPVPMHGVYRLQFRFFSPRNLNRCISLACHD